MWWGRCLLVSIVTIILVRHQYCKQQQVTMSLCGEKDREEENRREGNRAIFATYIHDSCLWNVSEHTNGSYNITLCPSSSGVNESAITWTSTPLYKAMPSLELAATQLHPTHKVKGFNIQHFRHRNLLTDLCFPTVEGQNNLLTSDCLVHATISNKIVQSVIY